MANLVRLLTDTTARHADRPAVRLDDLTMTYRELDDAVSRCAGLLRELGVERLGERTRDLGDLLIGLAEREGLEVATVNDAQNRGGIVPIRVADPKPVVDALAADGIIVDFRPGVVRCSPAFYNTEDEVRTLVERLARLVPSRDRRLN